MTSTLTEPAARAGSRTPTIAFAACLVSGTALLLDTVAIAVLNRSFGALDNVLFLTGFVAMIVGIAVAAFVLTLGRRPRMLWALGVFVIVAGLFGAVGGLGDHVARATYHGGNIALRGEWSFFLIGLQMLGLAALVRGRRSAH
jgi:hypothetical protein